MIQILDLIFWVMFIISTDKTALGLNPNQPKYKHSSLIAYSTFYFTQLNLE